MRRQLSLLVLVPIALLAVALAGCGGGGSSADVPSGDIAVVGDQTISKEQFDQLMTQAKAGYDKQHRDFPKAGTQEYEQLKQQAVTYLVQKSEFEQKANDLDISISDSQIDARLKQIKQQYFENSDAKYREGLKKQGLTEDQVRGDIKSQLLSEAIYKKVTADVTVSDTDVRKYYDDHRSQYQTPESREVRHILIACGNSAATAGSTTTKQRSCTDAKAEAEKLYNQLENGADFAALAKKYSDDPGSKARGGKLTVARGQTVAPFDQTAFLLAKGKLSKPLKTQYGYHIIQPLSDVKAKKVTPYTQVKESIKQQLLQQKKSQAMNKWVADTKKDFDVSYQVGYAPQGSSQQQ